MDIDTHEMASSGSFEKPAPIPEPHSWKGHPQPPPDERLLAARYFLADEDPDRCFEFASRISEIEEYVAYLESEIKTGSLQFDAELLKDVKVKITVHRDWQRRREEGIPDIGCDKKPWQLPLSTRTSATQAPARPNPVQASTRLPSQVREDHPPFSVHREDDHTAFIAALRKDASEDPDKVDTATNLLLTESRAYTWALQEPLLIPSWMHPTQSLPKKGVSPSDSTSWYQQPTAAYFASLEQHRPKGEWIPGYLLAREQRINGLLKTDLNRQEMNELEELLHFIEPPELHRLHAENIALDEDDALGLVSEAEQAHKQKVSHTFAAEQQKWLGTFTDVYFAPRPTSGVNSESNQPGVFFVDPGLLDSERQATLKKSNDLLKQISETGRGLSDLGDEDLCALENFLQLSQPTSITNLERQRAAILRQAGVKSKEDLASSDVQGYEEIQRTERMSRETWLKSLATNKLEFQYLRPGEMPEIPEHPGLTQVLYIPWEMASVPTHKSPMLLESAIRSSGKLYMPQYTLRFSSNMQAFWDQFGKTRNSPVDFTGKAERRGVQRAAIEIGLNLLASNQEQHRPADRFRVLDQSRAPVPLEKEIPISLPLEPSRRQEERYEFEFTKKMLAYKEWKDFDYEVSREKLIQDPSLITHPEDEGLRTSYGEKLYLEDPHDESRSWIILDPPVNYTGPFAIADASDAMEIASRRQAELSRIALQLQNAYIKYPRPLLESLLSHMAQGLKPTRSIRHRLYDDAPLTKGDLDLLKEISGESWDEISRPYPDPHLLKKDFPGIDLTRMKEFEADLHKLDGIPLWKQVRGEMTPPSHEDEIVDLNQIKYAPHISSQVGTSLDQLSLAFRGLRGNLPYIHQEIRQFLSAMAKHGRIQYVSPHGEETIITSNSYDSGPGNERVSRIPYSGHPENKFVSSSDEAPSLPYIRRNGLGQVEVQYDAQGTIGPPIIQPNKYEYLQRLAFRLGRDILRVLETLQDPPIDAEHAFADQTVTARLAEEQMKHITPEERGQDEFGSTVDLNNINLVNIAREVCSAAPHLAEGLGIEVPFRNPYISTPPVEVQLNETEAAALIQLKILEEIHNNFEPKFPVDETVWDFASERLATEMITRNGRTIVQRKQQTKFFSVRRYPICCQTKETKEAIKNSGPKIQEEPVVPVQTEEQQIQKYEDERAKAAEEAAKGPVKKARHIRGQRPYYPFGETPYQEAYQSHIMEYELRDVEEFNPQPKGLTANLKAGIKNTFTKVFGTREPDAFIDEPPEEPPNQNDPHPLPLIPAGWKPDNISAEEKHLWLIELAKKTPGFPDPNIKEYYHTQEEIRVMHVREEHQRKQDQIAARDAEISRAFGRPRDRVTWQEWAEWERISNINPTTGRSLIPSNLSTDGLGAISRGFQGLGQGQEASNQVVFGQRGGRRAPPAPIYAPVSTGNTPTPGQTPSTGLPTSTGSRRPSWPSTMTMSGDGEELTAEELQQYFADFEDDDGSIAIENDQDLDMEDIEQFLDVPRGSSGGLVIPADQAPPTMPTAADILDARNSAKEAMGIINNQYIEEAEIKAQMLQEEATIALQSGSTNAIKLREEVNSALKDVERMRAEQRRNTQSEGGEVGRHEATLYPSEDDDEGEDEDMEDDDDGLYDY
ncbi:hypothetical protein BKA64DRAFT_765442 [Cadophora sp. MPI-SDFR-AT-0126]|nr:hypothetical protein BKA64DRAFT_765442 [Leotiomycetes sp. MPI-SDFR-AT-0126]